MTQSPGRPIGIGIVGVGMIGQTAHLANFLDLPGARVVALADLRPGLAEAAASRFGIQVVHRTHRDLLADPAVDAVVVCTKRPATGPICLDALSAGKHVLSEKPMAHTVDQADRLIAACGDQRYAIGYMKRHDLGVQRGKALLDELIASAELGPVRQVRGYCYGGDFAGTGNSFVMTAEARPDGLELWPVGPAWLPSAWHDAYAWFLNVHCHDLNLLRYLLGCTPTVVAARLDRPNGKLALLNFGAFDGVLEMADVAYDDWREGVDVIFDRGSLSIRLPPPMVRNLSAQVELVRGGGAHQVTTYDGGRSWSFRRQAEAFLADIAAGREPLASGRDARDDLVLAEAIWRHHPAAA